MVYLSTNVSLSSSGLVSFPGGSALPSTLTCKGSLCFLGEQASFVAFPSVFSVLGGEYLAAGWLLAQHQLCAELVYCQRSRSCMKG